MEKFRELKLKLISSKRDSQRLERELLARACGAGGEDGDSLRRSRPRKLQDITQEHYKLTQRETCRQTLRVQPPLLQRSFDGEETAKLREAAGVNFMSHQRDRNQRLPACENEEETEAGVLDLVETCRREGSAEAGQSEGDIFERLTLIVRQEGGRREQGRRCSSPRQKEVVAARLAEIKRMVALLQRGSGRKWLAFYDDSLRKPQQADSFASVPDLASYQPATDRQALELSDQKSLAPRAPPDLGDNLQEIREVVHFGEGEEGEAEKEEADCTFLDGLELASGEKLWNCGIEEQDERKIDLLFGDSHSLAQLSPLEAIQEDSSQYCSLPTQAGGDYAADVIMEAESAKYKKIFWTLKSNGKPKQQQSELEGAKAETVAPLSQISRNGKLIVKFNRNSHLDQTRTTTQPKPKQQPSLRARPNSIANRSANRSKPRK